MSEKKAPQTTGKVVDMSAPKTTDNCQNCKFNEVNKEQTALICTNSKQEGDQLVGYCEHYKKESPKDVGNRIKAIEKAQAKEDKRKAKEVIDNYNKAGETVQKALCNSCDHCINPHAKVKHFETVGHNGEKRPNLVMKFCTIGGFSAVDVKECEMYKAGEEFEKGATND